MHESRQVEKLEHPTLSFIEKLQTGRALNRRTVRDSFSQDFINVLSRQREIVQENLKKKIRLQRRLELLSDSDAKRAQALQQKLQGQLNTTNKNREEQISKKVKKCRLHSRFVRKKFEKYTKTVKTSTVQADKNLREFYKTMEQYRLKKEKSNVEREKELYWKHVVRTQTEGDHFLVHENRTPKKQEFQNEERSLGKWSEKRSSANRSFEKLTPNPDVGGGSNDKLKDPINIDIPADDYKRKYTQVKHRADQLYQDKEQTVFQNYAKKMIAIKDIKGKKKDNRDSDGSDSSSDNEQSSRPFMTEVDVQNKPKKSPQKIIVKSLLRPLRYRSTELHRVRDHTKQNQAKKEQLQNQMYHNHSTYLQQYVTRFRHIQALKELRQELRQRKLHDFSRT